MDELSWEAWHLEKDEDALCQIYFKRPKQGVNMIPEQVDGSTEWLSGYVVAS
jgi:hypothetical protein